MKIALIGSSPSSINLAPFKDASYAQYLGAMAPSPHQPIPFIDETWQIWGCSPGAWAVVPRADRWFECHRFEPGQPWFSPQYIEFLAQFRGPVYTGGVIAEIPNHVVYPLERVEAEFSVYFLHSSLSLMMAIAILEIEDRRAQRREALAILEIDPGSEDLNQYHIAQEKDEDDVIGLFGVDMAANEEYGDQRSGCHFFILEALRRCIGIYVPPESCLLRPKPVYGISEWSHDYIKATQRAREINGRIQQAQAQTQEATMQGQFLRGALDNHTYWINTWTSPYGIPAGAVIRQKPGTGLGGGVTINRPMTAGVDGFVPVGSIEHEPAPEQYGGSAGGDMADQHVTLRSTGSIAIKAPSRTRPKPKSKRAK